MQNLVQLLTSCSLLLAAALTRALGFHVLVRGLCLLNSECTADGRPLRCLQLL